MSLISKDCKVFSQLQK